MLILCGQAVNNKSVRRFTFSAGPSRLISHYGNCIQSTEQEARSSPRLSREEIHEERPERGHPQEAQRQKEARDRINHMLPKAFRLSRKEAEALKNGRSVFTTLLSLRTAPSPRSQFSVSVSKKVAKLAVDRNRIRRRCYSAITDILPTMPKPNMVMVFPKAAARTVSYEKLVSDLRTAFKKAGIVS